jgi:hypothetical protein
LLVWEAESLCPSASASGPCGAFNMALGEWF